MEEDDFIRGRLLDKHLSFDYLWIGLSKAAGSWKWTSGENLSYSNWAPREPSNGHINAGLKRDWLQWDDINPDLSHKIICESNI